MRSLLASVAALTGIYLLVLTSLEPGDVVLGAVIAVGVVLALRPRRPPARPPVAGARAAADLVARTAGEMAVGSWRVARFCLRGEGTGRLVEIPRGDRTDGEVAIWGVATGEAPDEIVVDVDEARAVLVVHVVGAPDPEAVRARHAANRERWGGSPDDA